MCGCLLLVTTKLFGAGWGILTAALAAIPFLVLWFAIPMRRAAELAREQRGQRDRGEEGSPGPVRSSGRDPRSSRSADAAGERPAGRAS
jgi:hypothetical protein